MLGAAIMLCGMVMTALLIGEIANVLTNFDPALNAYRTSMDNLNQYITERNITTSLKRHLKEYYINNRGCFAKPTTGRCCNHYHQHCNGPSRKKSSVGTSRSYRS